MIVLDLHEITRIDSEITELHERLESLYEQRAELTNTKASSSSAPSQSLDDSINLDGIDLSL